MIEKENNVYSLSKDPARLIFRTTHFVADKGSLLHSGIYNKEFSSVLASFALAGLTYYLLVMNFGKEAIFYAALMLVFIVSFPLFRTYLFKERFLEAVFSRETGTVVISHSWLRKNLLAQLPLTDITGLVIDTKKTEIVNRDGVEFVEKISAQHNTVIPGFSEETIFYSLKLRLADGTDSTIFAHSSMQDVIAVHDEIKEFLKI